MSQSLKIPELRHCSDGIQETVSFFNYSAKRVLCLDKVVKLRAPKSKRTKLVTLCSARFVEPHTAVLVFRELLSFIVEALQGMSAWESSDTRKNASQLLHSLLTPQFIVALFILESVTGLMQPVSHLQKVGNDLIASLQNVDNLIAVLSQWRNRATAKFAELFQLAEELCQKLDVNLTAPRVVGKSQYRCNAGANSSQTAEESHRVNVFIPLLETISDDILSRFSAHQRQSTFSLAGLVPSRLTVLNDVKSAVEKYSCFMSEVAVVRGEFDLWTEHWNKEDNKDKKLINNTAIAALNACPAAFYPNINKLLRVLATLPSSTAEPERVFSKVTKTLSAVRSTMTDDCLEACVLLQVHRDILPHTTDVIEHFAKNGARRLDFLL